MKTVDITCVPSLKDVVVYSPAIYSDHRGYFKEIYNKTNEYPFVPIQQNVSFSKKGTLRGLHFQNPKPQAKLVTVIKGKILDVIVDLRKRSYSFSKHESFILSEDNGKQLYVPRGYAHGFLALEDSYVKYDCDRYYKPEYEHTLLYSDFNLGIKWDYLTEDQLLISEKDKNGKSLLQFSELF